SPLRPFGPSVEMTCFNPCGLTIKLRHLDRSEAQWRDPCIASLALTQGAGFRNENWRGEDEVEGVSIWMRAAGLRWHGRSAGELFYELAQGHLARRGGQAGVGALR